MHPTDTSNASQEWLSVPAVADALNIGPRTIYKAIKAGDLRAAKINGRGDLRIARVWLLAFMEKQALKVALDAANIERRKREAQAHV